MPKYLTSLRGEWRIALPGRRKSGREISRDTRRPVFALHARPRASRGRAWRTWLAAPRRGDRRGDHEVWPPSWSTKSAV